MQLTANFLQQASKVFTVSELTRNIRGTLETKFGAVWVQGEISNYKLYPSGHQYFTLKDQRAQISCVIWRDTMAPPRQPLVDAAQEIAVAIRDLATPNSNWQPLDLIVVTRVGGSIEDLWEFNEEIVARAIFNSAVPIVSAVGHEIDFTICDFVADLRAPTPSAAAELIVPDIIDLQRQIDCCTRALARQLLNRVRDAQQRLDHAREMLQRCLAHKIDSYKRGLIHIAHTLEARNPARELMMRRNRFADLNRRLVACPGRLLENASDRFDRME